MCSILIQDRMCIRDTKVEDVKVIPKNMLAMVLNMFDSPFKNGRSGNARFTMLISTLIFNSTFACA